MKIKSYEDMDEGSGTFRGQIISAEDEEKTFEQEDGTKKDQVQCHLMIKPEFEIKGETGALHEWLTYTDNKNSKLGLWQERLESLGIHKEDALEYVDLDLIFERADVNLGTEEKPFIIEDVILPLALPEDVAATPTKGTGNKKPAKKAMPKADSDIDFTELDKRLRGEGMSQAQINRWAKNEGIAKTDLNEHLESFGNKLSEDTDEDLWYIE